MRMKTCFFITFPPVINKHVFILVFDRDLYFAFLDYLEIFGDRSALVLYGGPFWIKLHGNLAENVPECNIIKKLEGRDFPEKLHEVCNDHCLLTLLLTTVGSFWCVK